MGSCLTILPSYVAHSRTKEEFNHEYNNVPTTDTNIRVSQAMTERIERIGIVENSSQNKPDVVCYQLLNFPKGKSKIKNDKHQTIIKYTYYQLGKREDLIKCRPNDSEKEIRCEICMYAFCDIKKLIYKLPCNCNKYYHANCIETWFVKEPICPYCKYDVNTGKQQVKKPDDDFEIWNIEDD